MCICTQTQAPHPDDADEEASTGVFIQTVIYIHM